MQTNGMVSLSRVAGAIVGACTWAWGVGAKWWWRLEAPVRGPRVSGQGCFRRGAAQGVPCRLFFGSPGPVTAAFPRRGRPCPARPPRVGAIVGATGDEERGGGAMATTLAGAMRFQSIFRPCTAPSLAAAGALPAPTRLGGNPAGLVRRGGLEKRAGASGRRLRQAPLRGRAPRVGRAPPDCA
jgi:hypothetical protein